MKKRCSLLAVAVVIALTGCANGNATQETPTNNNQQHTNHSDMNHSTSGELPTGLKAATNPTYKVGSIAIIKAEHMPGMNGATATIVGAYNTTAYIVSYTPTTSGNRVTNHKWVIHEEIQNAGNEPFKKGQEEVLQADHMKGMKGARAVIESAEQTTVYMVDYTATTNGEQVKNHKWVTESELSAK